MVASRRELEAKFIEKVILGEIAVNKELSEQKISEALGFSGARDPIIREVLARLAEDGVIGVLPKGRFWVYALSSEDAEEIILLRARVESGVIEKLARLKYLPEEESEELANLQTMVSDADCLDDFLKLDGNYRCALAAATGFFNGPPAMRAWSYKLRIFYSPTNPEGQGRRLDADTKDALVQGHHEIRKKIREGDALLAIRALEKQSQALIQALHDDVETNSLTPHRDDPGLPKHAPYSSPP